MALTARSIHIADRTLEKLENIDIHFSIPQVKQKEIHLTMSTRIPSMYKEGILFSGNNNKGEVLLEFFKKTSYYPMKVIFVDDKKKYLVVVETALEKIGIPFIGIRYGGCDERVKNFDPAKAERELAQFKSGLLPQKRPSTLFSYLCDWIYSFIRCFIPS